jgi:ferredoxin
VDYEHLKALGTIMGSGGMVVLDDEDCMVDVALFFMRFTRQESCGKCTFGRVGTLRMMEILEKLTRGEACADDLERLGDLGRAVRRHSLCGLGRAAPNPVLSALEYFGEEFVRHTQGICPAMKCRALIDYRIDDHCIGCTRCAQRCPADAIEPRPYRRHEIDLERCVRCDTCRRVCPVEAVCREPRGKERSGP